MKTSDVNRLIANLEDSLNSLKDKDKIQAGAEIHSGDGGYSIGTREAYEEFVKKRNYDIPVSRSTSEKKFPNP